jgi:DNA-binding transcriptional MerR regulator
MEKTVREFMEDLLEDLKNIDYIKPEDIPNIALYMDQVTTFMDEQLAASKRHEDDKILTKTMINNYAKNNLLPPPEKKKYSREHVLTLLFIYYFKNILSISDIQSILNPITDRYFGNKDGFNMQDVYNEVFALEKEESQKVYKDLCKKIHHRQQHLSGFSGGGQGAPARVQLYLPAELRCLYQENDHRADHRRHEWAEAPVRGRKRPLTRAGQDFRRNMFPPVYAPRESLYSGSSRVICPSAPLRKSSISNEAALL